MRRTYIIFIILCCSITLKAQDPGFIHPFDFRMLLSGTFGELRSNHFHSGIDIKTGGVEGKPVKAIADGWVSRIKISPYGFGKAVYINHPSGHTSVYGHLQSIPGKIGEYAEKQQYKLESFAVDITVPRDALPVKQGDIIGISGNSGSSGGPHLHFEIRDAATQEPLDPMQYGMKVKDFIRPSINGLMIYPEGPGSKVNGSEEKLELPVFGWGPKHRIEPGDTLRVTGAVSFGIRTHDLLNDANNRNGVLAVEAFADGEKFFGYHIDRFSFYETRYLNSLIDYATYKEKKRRYQRTRIDPNNRLSIYDDVPSQGILKLSDGTYEIRVVVTDHSGNESELSFPVIFNQDGNGNIHRYHQTPGDQICLSWERDNVIEKDKVKMVIPGKALYDNVCIDYEELPEGGKTLGPRYSIHNDRTPLHTYCNLSLDAEAVPPPYRSKAVVVKVDERGNISDAGGDWKDGWMQTRVREFGTYSIALDTLAPTLVSLNISNGSSISGRTRVNFKIGDNLSGIDEYRIEVNGKWVLADYDAKRDLLTYTVKSEHFNKGGNTFMVKVRDDKGNVSQLLYDVSF